MGLFPKLKHIFKKRKFLTSFVLGSLLALSQAPLYLIPFVFISLTGLLLLTSTETSLKNSFWVGWMFGLGYHVTGLYWIAFALGVDIHQFWWLIPFTVLGLPAFFAIWPGFALLFSTLIGAKGLARCITFAFFLAVGEWLRGHFLTGFPWNLIGYTWSFSIEMIQITSIIGIYGLTTLTILLGCLPYGIIKDKRMGDFLAVCVLFIGFFVFGTQRLTKEPTQYFEAINLRIVQPSISQTLKWDIKKTTQNYKKLLSLSTLPTEMKLTHIIWPESAIPFYLEENLWRRQEIMSKLPPNCLLITGGLRREFEGGTIDKIWNSLLVVDHNSNVIGIYDKSHLVPFGEYVPLRNWVPGIVKKVTFGSIDFSSGPGPRTLNLPQTPALSPLICYEGIFPGKVTHLENKPEWMINVTNDAWYGKTSGPYQHFEIVRMRAVEEGIPMVRVANTGISGIIDPIGRVLHTLELDEMGVIDTPLPKPLQKPTFFSKFKHIPFLIILFLILIRLMLFFRVLKKNNQLVEKL